MSDMKRSGSNNSAPKVYSGGGSPKARARFFAALPQFIQDAFADAEASGDGQTVREIRAARLETERAERLEERAAASSEKPE